MIINKITEKKHNLFFTLILGMLICIGVLTILLFQNTRKSEQLENTRYKLQTLGVELKESSENLTKYSRTYVLTGDHIWEQKYWQTLKIRNGHIPRTDGRTIPLIDSLLKLGISKNEFEKLSLAEKNSNDLVWTEKVAFNAIKGLYADSLKQFTIKAKPDTLFAQKILFNKKYHNDKETIMIPIAEFQTMLNKRTSAAIYKHKAKNNILLISICLIIISSSILSFYAILVLRKKIVKQLSRLEKSNKKLKLTLRHLKEAQSKLVQAEKMASLGILTAGVAHEINNPLNYLMGAYIGLDNYFKDHGSKDEKTTSILLNSIKVGLERTSNIVKGLNQFSSNKSDIAENCDLHQIIDNCLVILHNQLKRRADIKKEYNSEPIVIIGNIGKLHQVFVNILTNASHAINDNGEIKIRTRKNEELVSIIISDNGYGISKEHLKQIADPFFTTKPPGEGTGLGLSICYTIIKEHKGTIDVESKINKGTKVIIKIPNKT